MRNLEFKEIELHNFKCHTDISFNFSPNRFVSIVGDNGTGKSSIFGALTWALYDEDLEGRTGDSLVRHRSGKDTYVKLNFTIDEDNYEIHSYRKHSKHNNNKYLIKNGVDISGVTKDETLNKITQLVMPKDIFMNCLLFSQYVKDKKTFVDRRHSEQKDLLDTMLLLEQYNDYYQKATSLYKQNSSTQEELKKNIIKLNSRSSVINESKNGLFHKYNVEMTDIAKRISNSESIISELKHIINDLDISDITNQLNTCCDKLLEFRSNKDQLLSKIQTQKTICQTELNSYEEQYKSKLNIGLQNIQNEHKDLKQNVTSEISDLTLRLNNIINLQKMEEKDMEAKYNAKVAESKLNFSSKSRELSNELKILDSKISEVLKNISRIVNDITNTEKLLTEYKSNLDKDNPTCSACGQELSTKQSKQKIKDLIETHVNNLNNLNVQRTELESTKKIYHENKIQKESEIKTLELQYKEIFDNLRNKLVEVTKNIQDKHSEEISNIKNQLAENNEKLKQYDDNEIIKKNEFLTSLEKNKYVHIEQIKTTNRQKVEVDIATVEKLKLEISNLEKEKNSLEYEKEDYKVKITNIEYETKSYEEYKKYLENIEKKYIEDLANIEKEICDTERQISEETENIKSLERKNEIILFWKTAFSDKGIKAILLDESIPILNEKARELCEIIPNIRIRFNSQSTLQSGELRDKFNIEGVQVDNLSELNEFSAGERRISNIMVMLCLRHLLEKMQNTTLNILLLDEILDSLSPKNSAIAIEMIKKLSKDKCVVLISHTLRDFFDSDEVFNL